MAERPPGKGGPEEGTPEYDWLYGKGGKGSPSAGSDDATRMVPTRGRSGERPRPDETRVMPAQPRTSSGGNRPPGGPTGTAPVAPAPRPKSPRRRPRLRFGVVKLLVLLWLVFMLAVPFWAWSKVDKIEAMPSDKGRPAEQGGNTYLIVGSDSRDDLTEEERKELGTGGPVGQRTDTIMLLHTGDGPNLLMSIPRDSIVDIPGHGTTKVNAAFAYGGPQLLIRTLENETGIRIDDYIQIGFGGFVGMVDAVGGVEICPKSAMKDPQANLDIPKGCQEADGKTALGYARSRKTYSQLGDIDRARAQREVVSAIGDKALSPWTFINPVRYYRLAMASAGSFSVSEGTSPISLGRFAFAMTRVDGDSGLTCGVPIQDLAVTWDAERSEQFFSFIRDDDTSSIPADLCTPSGMPGR
ncbi:LCP family protein [Nocardioides sp. Soil805]|uniref:LCP family protein n=1 Tax=Nocardioides sp. Soil805 TaxID=1736416 RepID=UPI0007035072|nr:LCP family protein [Nocardioides sp. Soil805]KRF29398.1 transcriptional regulator [Nocardioides sp. Soil805]